MLFLYICYFYKLKIVFFLKKLVLSTQNFSALLSSIEKYQSISNIYLLVDSRFCKLLLFGRFTWSWQSIVSLASICFAFILRHLITILQTFILKLCLLKFMIKIYAPKDGETLIARGNHLNPKSKQFFLISPN